MQQNAAGVISHTEASTGAELSRFIKDGFARVPAAALRQVRPRHAAAIELQAPPVLPFVRRQRMSQTLAQPIDHVIVHIPVRPWVLSPLIPPRVLLAAQTELVTPALQVVQRAITPQLLDAAEPPAGEGQDGAGTPDLAVSGVPTSRPLFIPVVPFVQRPGPCEAKAWRPVKRSQEGNASTSVTVAPVARTASTIPLMVLGMNWLESPVSGFISVAASVWALNAPDALRKVV